MIGDKIVSSAIKKNLTFNKVTTPKVGGKNPSSRLSQFKMKLNSK